MAEYKNNHFVPRAYLRRFSPTQGSLQIAPFVSSAAALAARARNKKLRQIGLYHFDSDKIVPRASIRDQCSDDYFYSKNPIFEKTFGNLEASQQALINQIIAGEKLPAHGLQSRDHVRLCNAIMFQSGRTASAAAHLNNMANQFGKMMLKHHLEAQGNKELLEHLPSIGIEVENGVLDSIQESLSSAVLITDLGVILFRNDTEEDFLTSDHPIAQCNSLPGLTPLERRTGFASRGLVMLYPLTPRHLLCLYDSETYGPKRKSLFAIPLTAKRDVVELNLAQCRQALRSLYFESEQRVNATLTALRTRRATLRPGPTRLSDQGIERNGQQSQIRYDFVPSIPYLRLPEPFDVKFAARSGRYKNGNKEVRNFTLEFEARHELLRVHALREKATAAAKLARAKQAK